MPTSLVSSNFTTKLFESIYGKFDIDTENRKSIPIQILELISILWFAAIFLFIESLFVYKLSTSVKFFCICQPIRLMALLSIARLDIKRKYFVHRRFFKNLFQMTQM